ncbi:MAG TPA: hypothetical protein VKT73_02630 [Xanthobacteraceae bacterium]|nr:hypothetical protein [Xanthobacteraceae bacterium]
MNRTVKASLLRTKVPEESGLRQTSGCNRTATMPVESAACEWPERTAIIIGAIAETAISRAETGFYPASAGGTFITD